MSEGEPSVSQLLHKWAGGNLQARDELVPLVYSELRKRASGYLRHERVDHTLQATALVHEAFLRLAGQDRVAWQNRGHFYGVAARAMREVLLDYARRKGARKRSGVEVPIESAEPSVLPRVFDLLALDQALHRLAAFDERQARLVELRVFAGLTTDETAKIFDCSPATVSRDYRHAEAWLRREMRSPA